MGWFSSKDDPVDIFKDELMAAVHEGSKEKVAELVTTERDIPPAVFSKALMKAIEQDQREIAATILPRVTQPGGDLLRKAIKMDQRDIAKALAERSKSIDGDLLRHAVKSEKMWLFRLFAEQGYDFRDTIRVTRDDDDGYYKKTMELMLKRLECILLREELTELRKKTGTPLPPEQDPQRPLNKIKGLRTLDM